MKDEAVSIEVLFSALKACYKAMRNGGVLLHCRNGANRAPLIGASFVVAMTGCSAGEALSHVMDLRALTDICEKAPTDEIRAALKNSAAERRAILMKTRRDVAKKSPAMRATRRRLYMCSYVALRRRTPVTSL